MSTLSNELMGRRRGGALLVCCALLGAGGAWAQGVGAPRLGMLGELLSIPTRLSVGDSGGEVVSLPGAQAAARAWSLDVEGAQRKLESFQYARDAARGALLPRADIRSARGHGTLQSAQPGLSLPRREASTTISQTLFDEPARNEWGRQKLLVGSAELQYANALSQASFEGANAFLTALQARVTIELSGEYERMLGELLRYMSERAAAGGASQADSERVRARVANVRSGLADARSGLVQALRDLQRITGVEPGFLNAAEPLNLPRVADRRDALDAAKAGNPELRAAQAEVEAAEAERLVQRGRFLPRAELQFIRATNVNTGGAESYTRDQRAMFVLTWSLLNGGTDISQMRAAEARRGELDAKARNVERKLVLEIETAYANLEASAARYISVREELEANKKVAEAFQAQLTNASRQLLDVLDAYQRLYQSRLDLASVLVTEARNHLRLAFLTGALVGGDAPAPAGR